MSILGKVRISGLRCLQQFTQDQGLTDVIDVECKLSGYARGKVHIRASLHIRTASFDNEEWKLITLMCSHYVHKDLFAPAVAPWMTSLTLNKMQKAIRQRSLADSLLDTPLIDFRCCCFSGL